MGTPRWKPFFEAFGIKYVITPFSTNDGTIVPLVFDLLKDNDWTPAFYDNHSIVFLKNMPAAGPFTPEWHARKVSFVEGLILECNRVIEANPGNAFPYITKGDLLEIQSKRREARETYRKALEIAPLNRTARKRLESLD